MGVFVRSCEQPKQNSAGTIPHKESETPSNSSLVPITSDRVAGVNDKDTNL